MKKVKEKKKYNLVENIFFCFKKLKTYMGSKYFILTPVLILVSVAVPFLTAVLPSIVISVLTSDSEVSRMLLIVSISATALCMLQFILKRLELETTNEAFIFRIKLADEFVNKNISILYEDAESPEGKKKFTKAEAAIYYGNDIGVEAIIKQSSNLIINILGLIIYSFIAASLHPLLMILLIICPIARLLVTKSNIEWTKKHKEDWTPLDLKLEYLSKECLNIKNGKDIRLYQIQIWFMKQFNRLIKNRLAWDEKEYKRKFNAQAVDRIMSLIRDVSCYGYLIYRATQGMGITEFTLYLGIIGGFSQWVNSIFDSFSDLLENSIIISDYRDYMEQKDYIDMGGNRALPKEKTHTITLEDVWYAYPGTDDYVFKGLNLTIKKGEKLALVGVNGAGKTTLIKLICGLYKPEKGRVLLDGVDIREFNLKEYYSLYSVVFQEVFAFAFNIEENISCAATKDIDSDKVNRCIDMAGLTEKIASLENGVKTNILKDLEDDGINLSGGEMQKLMLARALYKESAIVILDEPTAALDPIAESEMYERYNSFIDGKTSIFISHRLSSTAFCDRVVLLKGGEVVECGSHRELIKLNGEYAKMYEVQSHYYQEEVAQDVC